MRSSTSRPATSDQRWDILVANGFADTANRNLTTGWDLDLAGQTFAAATATPDVVRRPMVLQVPSRFEPGAKTFLGTTIDSGTPAIQGLTQALDAICAHPNVAPFFCRQKLAARHWYIRRPWRVVRFAPRSLQQQELFAR